MGKERKKKKHATVFQSSFSSPMETLRFHYFNNSYQKHKSSDFILINKKKMWKWTKSKKKKN